MSKKIKSRTDQATDVFQKMKVPYIISHFNWKSERGFAREREDGVAMGLPQLPRCWFLKTISITKKFWRNWQCIVIPDSVDDSAHSLKSGVFVQKNKSTADTTQCILKDRRVLQTWHNASSRTEEYCRYETMHQGQKSFANTTMRPALSTASC